MSRYVSLFARLHEQREGAFIPFLMLGDPDPATSLELVRAVARAGADALELGIPFSDPVADGPAIQAAHARALSAGTRPREAWGILESARRELPDLPIGLLVYANLVFHGGVERFCQRAREAGCDGVLVADLPLLSWGPFEAACQKEGLDPVLIAPPNAPPGRLEEIARRSRGYVYVTSRPGVTGASEPLRADARSVIRRLRELGSAPPVVGFGVGTPADVRAALEMGAAGAIAGSALARKIQENLEAPGRLPALIGELAAAMKHATRRG